MARALAALLVVGVAAASVSSVHAETSSTSRASAEVRRATARYHDPRTALAQGYVAAEYCVEDPQFGGMGLHYANPALLADPAIDASRPEVVIYERLAGGRLRLAAVEWFAVDPDQDLSTEEGRPSLFGTPFDGPMRRPRARDAGALRPARLDLEAQPRGDVCALDPHGRLHPSPVRMIQAAAEPAQQAVRRLPAPFTRRRSY